ncbi:hypothetical protein [Tepidanaerobacter acetatoxydans]|uniref:hypothetical protein n=1 Tax=Tepidanaerobacter acetatoxydans TaxID=499229 RepID=UPI001BD638CF|nr:hypothetical protein [Tepidanaerobacter acetatoxydans]
MESAILLSGIKNYIPASVGGYMAFSAVLFVGAFYFFRRLGIAAIIYAGVMVYVPYAVLGFMALSNQRKIKGMYINFLNTFTGFYVIEGNLVNSLNSTSDYVAEPLRSILKRHVLIYQRAMRSMDDFLNGIMTEISGREFKKFFKFAKLQAKYGGNFQKALAKLREQGEKLASVESLKGASAAVSTMIVMVMIGINLVMIFNISKEPEMVYTLRNTLQGQMILASNAVSIIFALYMVKNINTVD